MRKLQGIGRVAAALAAGAFAVVMSGCGLLSIESWVKLIEAQSSGTITLLAGPKPLSRLQGGFLGLIQLNTNQLPAPLDGTITLEDIRIAAGFAALQNVCVWGNPAGSSSGTVHLDVLGGTGSVNLNLDVLATTGVSQKLLIPPAELKEPVSLSLSGVTIQSLLAASQSGSADGLFATTAAFNGNTVVAGIPATFALNLAVTNSSTPPLFDPDLAMLCGPLFAQQTLVPGLFYGINSKSSYLTAMNGDNPSAPLVISLSDVGAVPGSTLHITRIGTFADATQLKNGNQTKVSGVFSSTNAVLGANVQDRVPDAIQSAAPAFVTPPVFQGFFLVPTDIPQDFLIDPEIDVVVPANAAYLIVAPFSRDLTWGDNSGFSLGVALELK